MPSSTGPANTPSETRSLRYLGSYLTGLVRGRLWLKVLVGIFLGLGVGVLVADSTPRSRRRCYNASSKCSPSVGAAITPLRSPNTVWYRSSSSGPSSRRI